MYIGNILGRGTRRCCIFSFCSCCNFMFATKYVEESKETKWMINEIEKNQFFTNSRKTGQMHKTYNRQSLHLWKNYFLFLFFFIQGHFLKNIINIIIIINYFLLPIILSKKLLSSLFGFVSYNLLFIPFDSQFVASFIY